jgi:hypothetical protein
VIRNSTGKYTELTYPPVHEGVYNSPFKGLRELECYDILYQMNRDTKSELYYYYFVIVDEQSIKDHTVKLCGLYKEGNVQTMRVEFKMANTMLGALSVGHCSFADTGEY